MWLILSSYLHIQVILLRNYWTKQTQLGEGFSQAWFYFSIHLFSSYPIQGCGMRVGLHQMGHQSITRPTQRQKEREALKTIYSTCIFLDCGTEETRTGQTGRTCMRHTEGRSQPMDSSSGPRTVISIASLCTPDFTFLLSYCFFVVEMCC